MADRDGPDVGAGRRQAHRLAHASWSRLLRNVDVGIARTLPELDDRPEVREVEALNLAAIAAARHTIYLENQYLAARRIVEALAARLKEDDGPEIVIVLPRRGNNPPRAAGTMDSARHRLIQVLWAADEHRRLGVYWPATDGGTPIYVHSKVLVVDDRLLRIGSSNLNNRSMGFDSECDVAIEAEPDESEDDEVRQQIIRCGSNWWRSTWACPSASSRQSMLESRVVAEGHRGTSRRRQDVAAVHRERPWPMRRARWRRTT